MLPILVPVVVLSTRISIVFRKVAVLLASASLVFTLSACEKPTGDGLPTVASPAYGTVPEINFPGSKPPQSLVTKVLDQGDGKGQTVGDSDFVVVDYYGKIWGGATLPDSTITDSGEPRGFSLTDPPIKAWSALRGAKVGQRLMLVVPPSEGYGDLGSESIGVKKDDTLAYVVDIRLAVSPGASDQFQTTPTNEALPSGIVVSPAENGGFAVDATAAGSYPTKQQSFVYAQGNGEAVQPGQSVVVKQISADWGKATEAGDWNNPKLNTAPASTLKAEGLPLGSIVVTVYPATSSSDPRVELAQILASYDPSR